ncbi:MAG: TonB-dependent receptor, partial [Methylobacteriaceae bacterium]|nr:TonB-dependent receptor [Methylobacteriaceae bacterium]
SSANYDLYIDNRFWIAPDVALLAGAKLFHDERDFRNLFVAPERRASRDYDGFNPKFGVLYQPAPEIQLFADVTKQRDVPDFTDLAQSNLGGLTFVPLRQQRALTAEIGTRGAWQAVRWDFTFYRSELRDELLTFNTNAALGIPATTFNAPRTRHQGFEFAATLDLWRDLSGPGAGDVLTLGQVWTYNDLRFVRDRAFGGNEIAGLPPHVLRTTLTYRRADGAYLGPTLDWVPRGAFVDNANTLRAPGFALLGFQAGLELTRGVSLYLDARNLTDARYVSDRGVVPDARVTAPTTFYPGEGRSVFAGLRATF